MGQPPFKLPKYLNEELGAIVGPPFWIPVETVSAISGVSVNALIKAIDDEKLEGICEDNGTYHVEQTELLRDAFALNGLSGKMLRDGALVERPRFPLDRIRALTVDMGLRVGQVAGLTGQRIDEVVADIVAGRLYALEDGDVYGDDTPPDSDGWWIIHWALLDDESIEDVRRDQKAEHKAERARWAPPSKN